MLIGCVINGARGFRGEAPCRVLRTLDTAGYYFSYYNNMDSC